MSARESKEQEVVIDVSPDSQVRGKLSLPPISLGVAVMLCNGGSHAEAERFIAQALHDAGCATLCVQLTSELAHAQAGSQPPRGDIEVLAARLVAVTEWLSQSPDMQPMN